MKPYQDCECHQVAKWLADLHSTQGVTRRVAAYALSTYDRLPTFAGSDLQCALLGDDEDVSYLASLAFAKVDGNFDSELLGALRDGRAHVREHAIIAIRERGMITPDVIAAILDRLLDPSPDVRLRSALTLCETRIHRQLTIPRLSLLAGDPDETVRVAAIESLARLLAEDPSLECFLTREAKTGIAQRLSGFSPQEFGEPGN